MMKEKLITVKEVTLKNNCPECYSTKGLKLTFKQKIIETYFYKSITEDISTEIKCNTCHSLIFPVQWTDDMEQVLDYQRKTVSPKKTSTYLKKVSWAIIIVSVTIAFAAVILTLYNTL